MILNQRGERITRDPIGNQQELGVTMLAKDLKEWPDLVECLNITSIERHTGARKHRDAFLLAGDKIGRGQEGQPLTTMVILALKVGRNQLLDRHARAWAEDIID